MSDSSLPLSESAPSMQRAHAGRWAWLFSQHWEHRRQRMWVLFIIPALVVYIVFLALPLFNSLRLSLYQGEGLTPTTFVGFENYRQLFGNPLWRDPFLNALGNTAIFFIVHMVVQNTLGLLFAALLSGKLRGRHIYRAVIFLPATLSVAVTGFLWTLILNPRWGMLNLLLKSIALDDLARPWLGDPNVALLAIALVSSWQWVGLPTMLFLAGLIAIPEELSEAAVIDGATPWTLFWRVKFPLLLPIVGIVSVLTFIGNFNAFDVVYVMAGARGEPGFHTDLLGTFFYRTAIADPSPAARTNMGIGAATATITFLILLAGVSIWLVTSRRRAAEGS